MMAARKQGADLAMIFGEGGAGGPPPEVEVEVGEDDDMGEEPDVSFGAAVEEAFPGADPDAVRAVLDAYNMFSTE